MEEKLNLTAGKRDAEDEEFGQEMDDMYEKVMKQFNTGMEGEDGGDMAGMMGNLTEMLQQMMANDPNGGPMPDLGKMNAEGGDGQNPMNGMGDVDGMADMLLRQLMDKTILYEPFQEATKELKKYLEEKDESLSPEDKDRGKKQLVQLEKILALFDQDEQDKDKLMAEFEVLKDLGDFPEELLAKNIGLDGLMGGGNMKTPNIAEMMKGMEDGFPNTGTQIPGPGGENQECIIF